MAFISKSLPLAFAPQSASSSGSVNAHQYDSQFDPKNPPHPLPLKLGIVSLVTNLPSGQPTLDQQKAVATMVNDAWAFDAGLMEWEQKPPLTVLLYSTQEANKTLGAGTYGEAIDGHTFAAPIGLADSNPKLLAGNQDTVAHEVSHCQGQQAMSRIDSPEIVDRLIKAAVGAEIRDGATKPRNNFYRMPVYFEEGKAWGVGDRFPGLLKNADSLQHVRDMIKNHTAAETAKVMKHFRTPSSEDGHWIDVGGEEFGALFFEFVRTQVKTKPTGPLGVPDIFIRYGKLAQALGRLGDVKTSADLDRLKTQFAALFKEAMGIDPDHAIAQYVAHMDETQGNDQARYAGTIYDVRGPQYAIPDVDPKKTAEENATIWFRALNGRVPTAAEKSGIMTWYNALPGVKAMRAS